MSDQDNLLGKSSQNSSQGEDHFLNFLDQDGKPMDESGAAFGGLRLPKSSKLLRPDSFDTESRPSNCHPFNARSSKS